MLHPKQVVAVFQLAALHVKAPAADVAALGDDHAFAPLGGDRDLGGHRMGLVLDVDDRVLRQLFHAAEQDLAGPLDQYGPARGVRVQPLCKVVVQRQHVVAHRLDEPEPLQLVQLLRHLLGEVVRLGPVLARVVELPDVVVEGRSFLADEQPRRLVSRHRGPSLVIDAAVAEHFEILRLVPLGSLGIAEGVQHADTLDRHLRHAVYRDRFGKPRGFEECGGDVDDVMKLRADFTLSLKSVRPVHDGTVARSAPVRSDLLGPLVRRIHRVSPADSVVVVGLRSAELVDARVQELRRLDGRGAVEVDHLVEGAVQRAFGRRAVVSDDVVDERIVDEVQFLQAVHQAADVMVGVFQEPGIDLHLATQDGLQIFRHGLPGRNLLVADGQLAILRDDTEFLLPRKGRLAQLVPAVVELALVLVRPFLRDVVRRVSGAGAK